MFKFAIFQCKIIYISIRVIIVRHSLFKQSHTSMTIRVFANTLPFDGVVLVYQVPNPTR